MKNILFKITQVSAITLLLVICCTTVMQAQTIEVRVTSETNAVTDKPELENLLYNLQPTMYINVDNTSLYGNDFKIVDCEPSRISLLYDENPSYATVKLIRLKMDNPQEILPIDLARLNGFGSLEYIQLIFEYDACRNNADACLSNLVQEQIIQGDKPVVVLYKISIPR